MQNKKQLAIELLSKDLLLYVDMLQCINRDTVDYLYVSERGVLIYDREALVYMAAIEQEEGAEEIISLIPENAELVVGHQLAYKEIFIKKFKPVHIMECHNAVYNGENSIDLSTSKVKIEPLSMKTVDDVVENYSNASMVSKEYIENRIQSRALFGAFINEEFCGFGGYHSEGSIGLLEILPSYRGKGIGRALTSFLINEALANKQYAYSQIKRNNEPSLQLHKKLGFTIGKPEVYWLQK